MTNQPSYNFSFAYRTVFTVMITVVCVVFSINHLKAQAVSQVITDYNGWWKTSASSVSGVRPDNRHHLLSFTFNGTQYSTGVNDAALTAHGETFVAGQYQALPLQNVNGTVNSNTKIGLGAMADGVYNGAGPAPSRNLGPYLNDGTNGLDLGTCVANLPTGTMFMSVSNIQAAKIGDGIPDIVVTQVADPSTSFDRYEFTDVNGNRIGNSLDIVLNNIPALGNWVVDFYEATGSSILTSGFTQTPRAIRLWAADFSVFGLNASNIANVAYFKINLSGTSDIAFVAYNATAITIQQVLDAAAAPGRRQPGRRPADVAKLVVAPNPSGGKLTVKHPVTQEGDTFSLFDSAGNLVEVFRCEEGTRTSTLDLAHLPAGNFRLVLSGNGKNLNTTVIIQ